MDKLICIGKNYLEHVKELGDIIPESPVIFLKPPSVVKVTEQGMEVAEVVIPRGFGSVHHEIEVLLRLNSNGEINGVSLGLDMTLRDLQGQLMEVRRWVQWSIRK